MITRSLPAAAMRKDQRPAAELMPVARLIGEETALLLDYWLARLTGLPVPGCSTRSIRRREGDSRVTGISGWFGWVPEHRRAGGRRSR
jgi:hypothetical protein